MLEIDIDKKTIKGSAKAKDIKKFGLIEASKRCQSITKHNLRSKRVRK